MPPDSCNLGPSAQPPLHQQCYICVCAIHKKREPRKSSVNELIASTLKYLAEEPSQMWASSASRRNSEFFLFPVRVFHILLISSAAF